MKLCSLNYSPVVPDARQDHCASVLQKKPWACGEKLSQWQLCSPPRWVPITGLVLKWTCVNRISGFVTPLDSQDELSNGRGERAYASEWSSCGTRDEHQLLPEKMQGRCRENLWCNSTVAVVFLDSSSSAHLFNEPLLPSGFRPRPCHSFTLIQENLLAYLSTLRASVTAYVMATLQPDIWLSSLSWAPSWAPHVSVHRLGISIHVSHRQAKLNNLNWTPQPRPLFSVSVKHISITIQSVLQPETWTLSVMLACFATTTSCRCASVLLEVLQWIRDPQDDLQSSLSFWNHFPVYFFNLISHQCFLVLQR